MNWYQAKDVQSVRLMFTWEAVQSALGGAIPSPAPGYADYWSDLTSVLTRLLARDIYVILAPWQFNAASGDTDIVYDGAPFAAANFADFWSKFAAAVNGVTGNDERVAFDLINEPHTHAESGNKPGDIGISLAGWFQSAQAAIDGIRGSGATNTIFVPGMAYTSAKSFTTNGSSTRWLTLSDPRENIAVSVHCYDGLQSASPTVLRDSCSALVAWARTNGIKVSIGEIALNAGSNGRPSFCSTFATAQAQWSDWVSFCSANNDVLVGWNWWGNSAADWWNQGDSCDPEGFHWGLTLDDGTTQTVYMDLIESSIPVPILYIRDNADDTGSEPNLTATRGWESPDVWVRQSADGIPIGEDILGGAPSVVYVSVTNRGNAGYAGDGSDVVRVYWAKAQAGLSWPAPWDGLVPKQGGAVAASQPIGVILPGQSEMLAFDWAATPNPADYDGDGHFCLLASIAKPGFAEFEGFEGPDLNQNVLNLSRVAWRNIHIIAVVQNRLGDTLVANHTDRPMSAQIAFEVLDGEGSPVDPAGARLSVVPHGLALDRLRQQGLDQRFLENLGEGVFQVRDPGEGISGLDLSPGDILTFGVEYEPDRETTSYAVRVTQFSLEGDVRRIVGGQTFVVGNVAGFTRQTSIASTDLRYS